MKKMLFLLITVLCTCFQAASQVGIGTNSPAVSAILELKSNNKGLIFPRTSTTTRLGMTGGKGMMMYDSTQTKFYFHTGSEWRPMDNWAPSGQDIYNFNSGNVGIGGVFLPAYRLTVNDDISAQGDSPTIRLGGGINAGAARMLWEIESSAMDYTITQSLDALWISRAMGFFGFMSDLVVASNGYVGVGTGTPETRLNVVGGTDVGNASGGYLQLGPNNGLNIGFDNNEIQGRNNGAVYRLHLNNGGGTVQIGSVVAPTTYSLAVNGKVICEELKIQDSGNWADYVFADNYSLRSFDELRNFINAHHHLPNIPDAATIEKNGIEIGDMQKRMMEKIEELTLYILQLEEKSRIHQQEIDALKAGRQ